MGFPFKWPHWTFLEAHLAPVSPRPITYRSHIHACCFTSEINRRNQGKNSHSQAGRKPSNGGRCSSSTAFQFPTHLKPRLVHLFHPAPFASLSHCSIQRSWRPLLGISVKGSTTQSIFWQPARRQRQSQQVLKVYLLIFCFCCLSWYSIDAPQWFINESQKYTAQLNKLDESIGNLSQRITDMNTSINKRLISLEVITAKVCFILMFQMSAFIQCISGL